MPQPTPEDLAEGAIYVARRHRRDLQLVGIWVGFFVVVGLATMLGTGLIHLLPQHHPAEVCNTVAQCNRQILSHPVHVKPMPGFPTFQGP